MPSGDSGHPVLFYFAPSLFRKRREIETWEERENRRDLDSGYRIPHPHPDIYFFFILGKMEWSREGRRGGEVAGTGKHIKAECN